MLTFLRPELLEEPAYSEAEYADGAYYYFNTSLQQVDFFWNLWNRYTGRSMGNFTLDRALGIKRIGVELCRKPELAFSNIRPCYVDLHARPYVLNLGILEPCRQILAYEASRAYHTHAHTWSRDDYEILWPQDLAVHHTPRGLIYYVSRWMGDAVNALACWRMDEIQCTDARLLAIDPGDLCP